MQHATFTSRYKPRARPRPVLHVQPGDKPRTLAVGVVDDTGGVAALLDAQQVERLRGWLDAWARGDEPGDLRA